MVAAALSTPNVHSLVSCLHRNDVAFTERLSSCRELSLALAQSDASDALPPKVRRTLGCTARDWAVNSLAKADKQRLLEADVAQLWGIVARLWCDAHWQVCCAFLATGHSCTHPVHRNILIAVTRNQAGVHLMQKEPS